VTDRAEASISSRMFDDPDFKADLARYPRRPFFSEQSIWAIFIYRFGRRALNRKPGIMRNVQLWVYRVTFNVVETITGIGLSLEARIGPGLRIYHFGNIFVHPDAVIGRNCTLRQGVTIGNHTVDGPVPTIDDDVEFGAYAQVLGNVHVARGAKIGPMSLVIVDVPAGATALGVPARILPGLRESGNKNASTQPVDGAPRSSEADHAR
jgi:serine O-acetyltransferase